MGDIHIVSHSAEPFRDRAEAGRLLAQHLAHYKGQNVVVLGIPRGGPVIAREIARALDADLDVVLVRKLGHPQNPELAVGALAEDGELYLDESLATRLNVQRSYIEQERKNLLAEIERRRKRYRGSRPPIPLRGRIAIVTDDGLATGATMRAALWALRAEEPKRLIAAVPVGARQAVEMLADDCDEIICLRLPALLYAVGQFYEDFGQVTDEEVVSLLRGVHEMAGSR